MKRMSSHENGRRPKTDGSVESDTVARQGPHWRMELPITDGPFAESKEMLGGAAYLRPHFTQRTPDRVQ